MPECNGSCGTREEAGLPTDMRIDFPGGEGSHPNIGAARPRCEQLRGKICQVKGDLCHVLETFRESSSLTV